MFDDGSATQPETGEEPAGVLAEAHSEGTLVDLMDSPFREVCCGGVAPGCRSGSGICGCAYDLGQHCRATCATCIGCGQECLAETCLDYRDFYSLRGLAIAAVPIGMAAVLANTSLDEDFRNWHDDHIKSSSSDELSEGVRWLGDGRVMIPIFAATAVLECFAEDDQPAVQILGHWGNRCSRSVLVGGPAVLGLTYLLGASRPCDDHGSEWKIFDDNNSVSGHAFIGATAFLNAANMTENVPAKIAFYGLSVLPAWSRINDERHYLSQVVLGWGIAWLAADVVSRTERNQRNWVVVPYASQSGAGLQSIVTY